VVLGRTLPREPSGFSRRTDLRQQRRQIARLHTVNGTLDSAAAGVAHGNRQPSSRLHLFCNYCVPEEWAIIAGGRLWP